MLRKVVKGLVVVGSLVGIASLAYDASAAGNKHFVGDASGRCSGAGLRLTFKVAGVADGEFVDVSAEGTATKRCVNRGDNIPPGQTEPISGTGTFGPAGKNGSITGSLFLAPDGDCPGNQRLQVTYEDITLELEDGLDFTSFEGSLTCTE